MKKTNWIITFIIITIFFISCKTESGNKSYQIRKYIPADKKLFDEIAAMDKEFFDAYNNCDLEKQASIYSNDIEYFHDKGGLMTSKKEIIDATKRYICGKVTRELVAGSIEVYPIKDYGAVQIGFHKFYNSQEPDAESKPGKFITIWRNENGSWKMAKVISLH